MAEQGTPSERAFAEMMEKQGWTVYKNGFPDFLCIKDGEAILVEVKGNMYECLTEHQKLMLNLLTTNRFKGYYWFPSSEKLIDFNISKPARKETLKQKGEHVTRGEEPTPEQARFLCDDRNIRQSEIADLWGIKYHRVVRLVLLGREAKSNPPQKE